MEVDVERLDWDEWNRTHIARHNVTPDETEQVCFGAPVFREASKGRVMAIGPTDGGRMLTIVLGENPREAGTYYAFTARPASRQERRRYAEAKGVQR